MISLQRAGTIQRMRVAVATTALCVPALGSAYGVTASSDGGYKARGGVG